MLLGVHRWYMLNGRVCYGMYCLRCGVVWYCGHFMGLCCVHRRVLFVLFRALYIVFYIVFSNLYLIFYFILCIVWYAIVLPALCYLGIVCIVFILHSVVFSIALLFLLYYVYCV